MTSKQCFAAAAAVCLSALFFINYLGLYNILFIYNNPSVWPVNLFGQGRGLRGSRGALSTGGRRADGRAYIHNSVNVNWW